ncbi:MAG TPA: class I SAM-dependent methyltransferase [Abditibacteriaceae bacterium]|jgi:SAM-dependent methyltransferase
MSQFADLAPYYDELMQSVPYDDWAEYVATLWTFAGHTPRRVLDAACGTGNVSFELARRGLDVVGVDLSRGMIEAAKQKRLTLPKLAPRTRFLEADLTDFDLGEQFDSATCLYDSLNYILDPAQLYQAFARIAAHVEKSGVWVFDMNSDYAFRADLFSQCDHTPGKALHYDWRAKFDRTTRICEVAMEFRRTRNGQTETFYETHRERAYELPEIKTMLNETGWDLEWSFDAYSLNPPHAQSERWYFVARKR